MGGLEYASNFGRVEVWPDPESEESIFPIGGIVQRIVPVSTFIELKLEVVYLIFI